MTMTIRISAEQWKQYYSRILDLTERDKQNADGSVTINCSSNSPLASDADASGWIR